MTTPSPTPPDGESSIVVNTVLLTVMITIIVAVVVQGTFPRAMLNVLPTPITIFLLFLAFGLILFHDNPELANQITDSLALDPENVQAVFLPPLIASELFRLNLRTFRQR